MKKKWMNNLSIKILSLILAAILWIVIINVDDPAITRTFTSIPVTLLNENVIKSNNKVYEIIEGQTVDVKVKGKKSLVDSLTRDDIRAEADLAKLSDYSEYHSVPIDVSIVKNGAEYLEASTGKIHTLVVKLEDRQSAKFKVNVVQSGTVEEGYSVGELRAKPNIVTVTGAKSQINKIAEVRVEVNVSNLYSDFDVTLEPRAYDSEGELIPPEKLQFSSKEIRVFGVMYKTQKIPLIVKVTGKPADGYEIAKIEYEPKEIAVAGKRADLRKIGKIEIPYSIEGATSSKEDEINLVEGDYFPEGVKPAADSQTTVVINVTIKKQVEKEITFQKSDIEVKNMPDEQNLDFKFLTTQELKVKIKGLYDTISGLEISNLKPYIDLSGLQQGKHTLKVRFEEINGIHFVKIPEVRIEIKKKEEEDGEGEKNEDSSTEDEDSPVPSPSPSPSAGIDSGLAGTTSYYRRYKN